METRFYIDNSLPFYETYKIFDKLNPDWMYGERFRDIQWEKVGRTKCLKLVDAKKAAQEVCDKLNSMNLSNEMLMRVL